MPAFKRTIGSALCASLWILAGCGGQSSSGPSASAAQCPVFAVYLTTQQYPVGERTALVRGKLLGTQSDVDTNALFVREVPFSTSSASAHAYTVDVLFRSEASRRMDGELSGASNTWVFTFVFQGNVVESGGGTGGIPEPASIGPFSTQDQAQHFADVLKTNGCQ
jgi:hypothetical protein